MDKRTPNAIQDAIQQSYDRIADEYAGHLYSELDNKPLDRELLTRFAARVKGKGEVCDMGCGPGHIARYLHDKDRGANRNDNLDVFGLDLSPGMLEEARRLNPEISFRQGDMLALDLPNASLAGIAAFYAIVNLPREALPRSFARWRAYSSRTVCCCSPFTSATKRCNPTHYGIVPSPWTSISFRRRRSGANSKQPDLRSKKSSSANPTRRKWNTRAGERISSRVSQPPHRPDRTSYGFALALACLRSAARVAR
jgi:hypothetical protein